MGQRRQIFLLALTILAAAPAAADAPANYASTYAIVRARFVPTEALANPDSPDPYVGVKVRGEVQITRILSGKPPGRRFAVAFWLPGKTGPLNLYLLVEHVWDGRTEIAAFSPVRDGFCIEPEQALDGPTADIARLRKRYPCKRH